MKSNYKLPERLLKNIDIVKRDALTPYIIGDETFYGVLEEDDKTYHYFHTCFSLEDFVQRKRKTECLKGNGVFPYEAEDLEINGSKKDFKRLFVCLKEEIIDYFANNI